MINYLLHARLLGVMHFLLLSPLGPRAVNALITPLRACSNRPLGRVLVGGGGGGLLFTVRWTKGILHNNTWMTGFACHVLVSVSMHFCHQFTYIFEKANESIHLSKSL